MRCGCADVQHGLAAPAGARAERDMAEELIRHVVGRTVLMAGAYQVRGEVPGWGGCCWCFRFRCCRWCFRFRWCWCWWTTVTARCCARIW
ncbi:hypothetical protein [Streptomyces palmae]|uniref:Uncharacterized protein n=1 Tax=Streptomyces palmae TaxID=1701085 RepID=A0A4Z0HHC8_9ACTN|nr:hypothetical protein [Streptomyces palmae]TGB15976.1 hypothetical protein E4099_05845 [Streptomyces palmae]